MRYSRPLSHPAIRGAGELLQDELDRRQTRLIDKRYKDSRLDEKVTLAEIDWSFNPKVPRGACFELHTLKFVSEGANMIFDTSSTGDFLHEVVRRAPEVAFMELEGDQQGALGGAGRDRGLSLAVRAGLPLRRIAAHCPRPLVREVDVQGPRLVGSRDDLRPHRARRGPVEAGDDPHLIFESLNAKGERLTPKVGREDEGYGGRPDRGGGGDRDRGQRRPRPEMR